MNEIVQIIGEISKSLLRLCFGMFLIWLGFTIHNLSKKKDKFEPIYVTQKDYDENEKKVGVIMDSISKLPVDEQLELVKKLAEEYNR